MKISKKEFEKLMQETGKTKSELVSFLKDKGHKLATEIDDIEEGEVEKVEGEDIDEMALSLASLTTSFGNFHKLGQMLMKLASSHEPQRLKKEFAQMSSDFSVLTKALSEYRKEMNDTFKEKDKKTLNNSLALKKLLENKIASLSDKINASLGILDKKLNDLNSNTNEDRKSVNKRLSGIDSLLEKKATLEELKKAISTIKQDFARIDDEKTSDTTTFSSSKIVGFVDEKIKGIKIPGGSFGGGNKIFVEDDGTEVGLASVLNFTGAGVNVSVAGGKHTIDISGGGGGGTPGGSDTQVQFNDGGSFGGDANFTYDKTNDVLHVHKIAGDATDGLIIESANGTDVGILGAANTANVNWYGSHNFSTATQDTIAGFTGSGKTLGSLSTATYPSLTELSYVKGVTSAIQTQINALANGMIYKGNWDASTGTFPGASVAQTGWFYTVSVAGTVDSVVFNVGDRLIAITNNASTTTYAGNWTQLDATDAVTSVFGRTGNVVATAGDYTAAQITNTPAGSIAAVNVQAAIDELATEKANASGALTQFVGNTAWRVFYSDGSGDITELALGASGTYLKSNGASSAPSFATPTGTGDVSKVGTPVNNQLGVWTGDGTLEGTADVTYDSSTKAMTFNQILDGATFAVYTANTAENSYSYLEFSDTEAAIDTPAFSLITGASLFSLNQGGTDAIFNVSGLASTNKTFTFPNATGTISLIGNTETLTNKTLTAPKFADLGFIADANGNELIIFDTVASAVNEITLANSATGGNPILSATGGDANVGFNFQAKGTGTYNLLGTASQQAELRLYEDTDNGTNYVAIKTPASLAADYTLTLPANDGDASQVLTTDGNGVLSWTTPAGTGDVTAASTFGTDNVVIKSDGTGKGVQSTGITIADTTNNMSGLQKLTVGIASTATGAIDFVGTTSGTVTVKTADAAGTWTLTLPTNDGDANQVLTTNGSGVTSWTTITSGTTNNVTPTARLATTAALPSNTYSAGVLTASANGVLTVDGVNVVLNDIILVKDEASGLKNGLYTCTTEGTASVPYVLTRHTSMDATGEFVGAICPIGGEGTLNKNTVWRCTNTSAPTVGTTAITFTWEKKLSIKCRVYATGTTTLTNVSTWYAIAFAGESFDAWAMHDTVTNNSRITFPIADTYAVGASIRLNSNAACGARIVLNGSTVLATQKQGNSGNPEHLCVSTIYSFSAGDYVEVQAINVSGSGANIDGSSDTSFWTFNI